MIIKIIAPAWTFLGLTLFAPSRRLTGGSVKGIYGKDLEGLRFEKYGFGSKRVRKVFTALLSRVTCLIISLAADGFEFMAEHLLLSESNSDFFLAEL